jgi:hypothetical protein
MEGWPLENGCVAPTVAKRRAGARARHICPLEWMDREGRGSPPWGASEGGWAPLENQT